MPRKLPEGYHTLNAIITTKNARRAIDFYKSAFGATQKFLMPGADGKHVMHAELRIGDSTLMLSDEQPGIPCKSAETLGDSPVAFYLYVPDADRAFRQAITAGAVSERPMADMFWGDRLGTVKDPFGYTWTFATHIRDVSPEEMERVAKQSFAAMTEV